MPSYTPPCVMTTHRPQGIAVGNSWKNTDLERQSPSDILWDIIKNTYMLCFIYSYTEKVVKRLFGGFESEKLQPADRQKIKIFRPANFSSRDPDVFCFLKWYILTRLHVTYCKI